MSEGYWTVMVSDLLPPREPEAHSEPNDLLPRRVLCPSCGRNRIQNKSGFCSDCRRARSVAAAAASSDRKFRDRQGMK